MIWTQTRRLRTVAALAMAGWLAAGCALLAPLPGPTALDERLASLPTADVPVERPVTIRWDDHQIPYIEADSDGDAAFALGLVHAHLRLGQMTLLRHATHGRLAEIAGPIATDIDHALRLIGFARAAPAIVAALPPQTKTWVDRFVAGINHYQRNAPLPREFALFGITPEPWTAEDVIAIGRLGGTDVNWLVWAGLLPLRERPDWPQIWQRLVKEGIQSLPSFGGTSGAAWERNALPNALADALAQWLAGVGRTGSNSIAVAGSRTASGKALIANDPHLGFSIPNIWVLVGLKSPSYHAVGMMAPGIPVFAIGRNPWTSWGGTNMRAAVSDLVDLSGVDPARLTQRRETIKVRWWFDREITLRDSPWGPVISDAPALRDKLSGPLALRWTGHQASDEITALLEVSRARDFDAFRRAFRDFAVPPENMIYADANGNIGQVMAVLLPRREARLPHDLIVSPAQSDAAWQRMASVETLPFAYNPPSGFLASANNRPAPTEFPVSYFYSPNDRMIRMNTLMDGIERATAETLKALQADVVSPSAVRLRDLLIETVDRLQIGRLAGANEAQLLELIRGWDGAYRADSRAALAFELFRAHFIRRFYVARDGVEGGAAWLASGRADLLLPADMAIADDAVIAEAAGFALRRAGEGIGRFADWGAMHRLELGHPLSMAPVIGSRYLFADLPVGGSSETLMKTAHGNETDRHASRYGQMARHVSDLADLDANDFVLLGGQDGWFGSANFLDQLALWRTGRYVRLPLSAQAVRDAFGHTTVLTPVRR